MQLPFNFCVRQKPVGARDLIDLSVLVRGFKGEGFFFFFLGTAVLFQPLTAGLVDLDQ